MIQMNYGSGLLRHGLIFSRAWRTMQLIIAKDWKHVSMQKMVSLNTCCDVACLTFKLARTATALFRATRWWRGIVVTELVASTKLLYVVSTGMGDVSGFDSRRRHFISVCNQPPKANSAFHPFGVDILSSEQLYRMCAGRTIW